jgi:spore coat protein CotH
MSRTLILVLLLAAFAVGGARAQNPGDSVFAGIQIHEINIHFYQQDYWDSLTIYYEQGNEQYIAATVILDGMTLDSVGVRLKGNSSYSHPNNKKSLRLAFDQYRPDQRWDNLKGVHINNCWGDPTFMREKVHLDFCRDAGIHAPRANFARVSFNDTLWAFYSLVEHVNKTFLSAHYGDNTGDLFKAVDGIGGSVPELSNFKWYTAVPDSYYTRYEMKTDGSLTAWPTLVTLLDTLNNSATPATSLGSKIDLTTLYKALATDNLFSNLDSYVNSSRNFYVYFHPITGKMEWIVWDAGLSLGVYSGGVSNMEGLSVTYVSSATNRPLLGKILNTPTLKNEYLRNLCLLYSNYFSAARLFPHIDSIANAIRSAVYEDPRKMYTNAQFETNIVSDVNASGGGGTRKPGLKSFINLRSASVQTQLTTLGVNCSLTLSPGDVVINEFEALNDSIADPAAEYEPWFELYNNTSNPLDIGGTFLTADTTQPTLWQFPANTTIPANGYLVVWADGDTLQSGLHTNFTLPAGNFMLRFSNLNGSILDTVSAGSQLLNRSMARIPNGTGLFRQARPTILANNNGSVIVSPTLTTLILPQCIEGINGTNLNRIPFTYRARISGLLPSSTYRYINQVVTSADPTTTNGSGNCLYVQQTGDFVRTTGPSISTSGAYGTFTTDVTGSYDGWFITEPTGNVRFVPGRYVFMRIGLNDGGTGTTVDARLTTTDSVRVVKLDAASGDSTGTGFRCTTLAAPKDFVFVYDNASGSGRPVSGALIESDGTANTTGNSYAAFYGNSVNGVNGAFGMVLPNALATGIRRVERRALGSGVIVASATDDDGHWPSGTNTVNPSGGTTEIVLAGTDVKQLAPVFTTGVSTLSFGTVALTASKTDSVIVRNPGASTLTLQSVAASPSPEFSTRESGAVVIAGGDSAWIHVTFQPAAAGTRTGMILFTHNAMSTPDTVALAGVGGGTVSATVGSGWNMISNPVAASNDSVRALYPSSIFAYAFSFVAGGGYQQSYRMANGTGYWEKFPAAETITFSGMPISRDTIDVTAGWNMIGTISSVVDTASIVSIPVGIRASNWFGYASGYSAATQLVPGKAYWIKANAAGQFILIGSAQEAAIERKTSTGNGKQE